jgi:hypothetical protein
VEHLSRERLAAGLDQIRDSPRDGGRLVLLVRRPAVGERDTPGRQLRLRGMNTRVVEPGTVRLGDLATKAPAQVAAACRREPVA